MTIQLRNGVSPLVTRPDCLAFDGVTITPSIPFLRQFLVMPCLAPSPLALVPLYLARPLWRVPVLVLFLLSQPPSVSPSLGRDEAGMKTVSNYPSTTGYHVVSLV